MTFPFPTFVPSSSGVPTPLLRQVSSARSSTGAITLPTGIQNGDVGILFDSGRNNSTNVTLVTPSGWTSLTSNTSGSSFGLSRIDYKVMSSSDSGTSITGSDTDFDEKIVVIFRSDGSFTPTTITSLSTDQENTTGTPATQNLSVTGAASPVLMVGFGNSSQNDSGVTLGGTISGTSIVSLTGRATAIYEIQIGTFAARTLTCNDSGARTNLLSASIKIS